MKNLLFTLAVAALLPATGCKNIDKELAGKMQADLATMEGLAGQMEQFGTSVNNTLTQISSAPEGLVNSGNAEYNNLREQCAMMMNKYQATQAAYNDMVTKLKNLSSDYVAGKMKTEDARKEYEAMSGMVSGLPDLLKRMAGVNDQMQTQYAKISADWNAQAEGAGK